MCQFYLKLCFVINQKSVQTWKYIIYIYFITKASDVTSSLEKMLIFKPQKSICSTIISIVP